MNDTPETKRTISNELCIEIMSTIEEAKGMDAVRMGAFWGSHDEPDMLFRANDMMGVLKVKGMKLFHVVTVIKGTKLVKNPDNASEYSGVFEQVVLHDDKVIRLVEKGNSIYVGLEGLLEIMKAAPKTRLKTKLLKILLDHGFISESG